MAAVSGNAQRDENDIPTLLAVSSVDQVTPVVLWANPTTHRLLVDSGGITIGTTAVGSGTVGSVLFVGTGSVLQQNNSNFYLQNSATTPTVLALNTNVALSINTSGDFTGTDAMNVYGQYDAYLPNSFITNSLVGLNTDGAFPGYTSSSSRGTGASPIQLNSNDMVGGYFGFGAQGVSSPTYKNLGGMSIITTGSSNNNLGGEIDFYTKGDGGSLVKQVYIENNGVVHIGTSSAGTSNDLVGGLGLEVVGSNNTAGGINIILGNRNSGINAFCDLFLQNDLADATGTHYAVMNLNSSGYTSTAFGTIFAVANQLQIYGTDGPTTIGTSANSYINFFVNGTSTSNEILRVTTTGLQFTVGKITKYNAIATVGGGVPATYASYSTTGNSGAVSNAINYTPPATAGRYRISGIVNMTAWTTPATFTVVVTYKDDSANARTETLTVSRGSTGATAAAVTAIDRWYFELPLFAIDNSATAITCSTTGTFTGTPAYNLSVILEQLA